MPQSSEQEDEIDLAELFAALWHNWWIIGATTVLTVLLAGYYAFVMATPEFEASTRFELLDGEGGGSSPFGEAAGLAALAGLTLGGGTSEADALEDRILSRPFVASIYERAEFRTDPEFNETLKKPDLIEQTIKLILGSREEDLTEDDYLVMVIENLEKRMSVEPGENGIIELIIAHPDGERAALIANIIVNQSLSDIFDREQKETRESLAYFADELLEVRANLDAANAAVRDYAINNNLQSVEELTRTSVQLSQMRRDLEALEASAEALRAISGVEFSGIDFAEQYPVSTSLSFRRLFNFSGNPSDWTQPSAMRIEEALLRVETQRASLTSSLNSLEARARSTGQEALELAALEREVEVQQAIYESVITQFEAQSLFSGYERASGRIVETAIAPNEPSSPKKILVVALGLVLGLFVGAAVALIRSVRKGLLYTKTALKDAASLSEVFALKRSRVGQLNSKDLSLKEINSIRDILVSLADATKVAGIVKSNTSPLGDRLTLSLSKAAQTTGDVTAILDLSVGPIGRSFSFDEEVDQADLKKASTRSRVDIFRPRDTSSLLKTEAAKKVITYLTKDYDRLFILLPPPSAGTASARVFALELESAIVVAERKKTTRTALETIKSILSKSDVSDPILVII